MCWMLCSLLRIKKNSRIYLCPKRPYSLGGITNKYINNLLTSEKSFPIYNYKWENQKETGGAWGDEGGGDSW